MGRMSDYAMECDYYDQYYLYEECEVENIDLGYEDMCGDCCEETVEDTIAFVLDDIITAIIQKGT